MSEHSSPSVNLIAAELHAEVERIWPTPPGDDIVQRQALALTEEVGEIARAILKRSHASRSPNGVHKGYDVEGWTANLHTEIGQAIGVALQLAHIEGMDIDEWLSVTVEALRARACILESEHP